MDRVIPVLTFVALLSNHDRFVADTAWAGGVIRWEIGVGLGAALLAAYFWRKGLQRIRAV